MMAVLIIGLVLGLGIFGVGIWTLSSGERKDFDVELMGSVCVVIGAVLVLFIYFVIAPHEIPSGLPITIIDKGEYKAAFVYVAGDKVSVGIEKKDSVEDNHEHIYLYQFPKSAFDGPVNPSAKKLVVVEIDGFKKLVLK